MSLKNSISFNHRQSLKQKNFCRMRKLSVILTFALLVCTFLLCSGPAYAQIDSNNVVDSPITATETRTTEAVSSREIETASTEVEKMSNNSKEANKATETKNLEEPELPKENPENKADNLNELARQILTSEEPKSVLRDKLQEIYNDKDLDAILSHVDMEKINDGNSLREELAKAGLAATEEASLLEKATILAANAGQDVSEKLEIINVALKHYYFDENWNYKNKELDKNTAVRSYLGESAYLDFEAKIPEGVKAGDYFVIDYGKYVLPGGINVPRNPTPLITKESFVIAYPIYDEVNNRTVYQFTNWVEKHPNMTVKYSDSLWPNYDTVTTNKTPYKLDATIANKALTQEVSYDYGNGEKGSYAVVEGAHVEADRTNHTLTQVWHINRDGDKITDGNHSLLLESTDDDLQTFEVYEVTDDKAFTDSPSYNFNPAYVKKVDTQATRDEKGGLRIDLQDGIAQGKRYVVKTVVHQKAGAKNNVVWLSLRNKDNKNAVVENKQPATKGVNLGINFGSTESDDEINKKPGYFIENHHYVTVDEDGKIISEDDFVTGAPQVGHKNEEYTTGKIDRAGYTYVKVEQTTNDPKYDKDGKETKGNYKPGKTLSITYLYQKTVITKGKFQEHHIFETVDENGKLISTDATVDKDVTEGTEKESYKTSKLDEKVYKASRMDRSSNNTTKIDIEHYKLVKVEAKEGGKFDKDGKLTEGKYIANKKQEVTYIYQKKVITKGKFQEHHIFQTVDENGKLISTDATVDKDVTEGTEKESYKTSKLDEKVYKASRMDRSSNNTTKIDIERYKLVKVEAKEGGKFDKDGKLTEGKYIANKKQEVTYIYQKTVIKPLKPTKEETIIPRPSEPVTTSIVYLTPKKQGKVSKTGELASSSALTFYLLMTVAVLLTKQKKH